MLLVCYRCVASILLVVPHYVTGILLACKKHNKSGSWHTPVKISTSHAEVHCFFVRKHKKYHTVGSTTPGVVLWFAYADGMMPVCGLMSWYAAAMVLVCCWHAAAMLLVCSWYATLCYWYLVCHPKHSRRLALSTLHL